MAETCRGRGIGRLLMGAFEDWARSRDSVLVSLATRGAAAFYEHLGYSSKAAYYKSPWTGSDGCQGWTVREPAYD